VLAFDVDDLDRRNRCAKVHRKGGAVDVIVWQTGTARLLPRLLGNRKTGPVFLTDRRARVELSPSDLDPVTGRARLSYRRSAELFEQATGGATLRQLRHSALTHAAEAGASTATPVPAPRDALAGRRGNTPTYWSTPRACLYGRVRPG
jgi:integrase